MVLYQSIMMKNDDRLGVVDEALRWIMIIKKIDCNKLPLITNVRIRYLDNIGG